mgnify:CR=1 FL=1
MATKSMLKDVEIRDKKFALDFVNALDVALTRAGNNVSNDTVKRECKELSGEEINKFFNM